MSKFSFVFYSNDCQRDSWTILEYEFDIYFKFESRKLFIREEKREKVVYSFK